MSEQSDTPRTDAAVYIASDYDDVVGVDLARDLERALATATRERDEARASEASALNLVSRVREALGDNGKLMQDELIEHCRTLAGMPAEVERLRVELFSVLRGDGLEHLYDGDCPASNALHARDQECPACKRLNELAATEPKP